MRKKIAFGEKVEIRIKPQDKQLLLDHTFCEPEFLERLESISGSKELLGSYTMEELDEILGHIAAEANHAEEEKVQIKLEDLYDQLSYVEMSYEEDEEGDNDI